MHYLLEPEVPAIECDRGIHVLHDIADLYSGHGRFLANYLCLILRYSILEQYANYKKSSQGKARVGDAGDSRCPRIQHRHGRLSPSGWTDLGAERHGHEMSRRDDHEGFGYPFPVGGTHGPQ